MRDANVPISSGNELQCAEPLEAARRITQPIAWREAAMRMQSILDRSRSYMGNHPRLMANLWRWMSHARVGLSGVAGLRGTNAPRPRLVAELRQQSARHPGGRRS